MKIKKVVCDTKIFLWYCNLVTTPNISLTMSMLQNVCWFFVAADNTADWFPEKLDGS